MYALSVNVLLTLPCLHSVLAFIVRTVTKVKDWNRECCTVLGAALAFGPIGGLMELHDHLAQCLVEPFAIGTLVGLDIIVEPVELSNPMCRPSIPWLPACVVIVVVVPDFT